MTELYVSSPEYNGPERRRELRIERCVCHLKHEAKLTDHDKRLDKLEDATKADHRDMWEDIKAKVPLKLFYTFLGIVIMALGYLVVAVTSNSLLISKIQTNQEGIKRDNARIERNLEIVHNQLQEQIKETRKINGMRTP